MCRASQNAGVDGAMANASTLVVSRDNNLYVVGDISKKCLDTTETNNYQVCELVRDRYELREQM